MSEKITNYIPISRKLFDHVFFSEERTFSKFEAWIDLLQEARYELKEGKRLVGGKVIKIKRGEIPASLRFLAERWKWSRNKVDSFLKLLESEQMITKRTAEGTAQTVISICKYDTYNPPPSNERTAHGTTKGQGRDSIGTGQGQSSNIVNKEKEECIGENEKITPPENLSYSDYLKANEGKGNFDRRPNTPTKDQVWEFFQRAGGTKEMAKAFWDSNEATGWHYKGSPIIKFESLANKYIASWYDIEEKNRPKERVVHTPKLKTL